MRYNPLRYRGYVYDTETGFYYLQSRYYDPETGKFISPDSYISTGQGVLWAVGMVMGINASLALHQQKQSKDSSKELTEKDGEEENNSSSLQ